MISSKPVKMPAICGTVRRMPKFTPDTVSMMLLGPGVIERHRREGEQRGEQRRRMKVASVVIAGIDGVTSPRGRG